MTSAKSPKPNLNRPLLVALAITLGLPPAEAGKTGKHKGRKAAVSAKAAQDGKAAAPEIERKALAGEASAPARPARAPLVPQAPEAGP